MLPRLSDVPGTTGPHAALLAELRLRGFEGDLTAGAADRTVLATDNSLYQVAPAAVVFPRTTADLVRIAKVLAEPRFRAVVAAPRGGGTGTNGQSLTPGLVVDLSRHMNAVLEIDVEERWVRVEAGTVKDELNAALKPHGLMFPPELSTSSRATIGGMISTDACGQGSCHYGKTRDHVLALTTVLSDGTVWTSEPLDEGVLAEIQRRPDRVGEIHRIVDAVERENRALIASRFPRLNRCLTGYDLAHIRDMRGRFDLNAVLCGSEGTLGFLAEARLNVVPIPRHAALVNLRYDGFDAALRDARTLIGFAPASIETVDSTVLGLAQADPVWASVRRFFPEDGGERARGVNLVEFLGDTAEAVEAAVGRLAAALDAAGPAAGRRGFTVARQDEVPPIWDMRKKAVGLLGNAPGEARPVPFVEDTAVPPERLADYIAEFRAALDARGLAYGMFGHVDAGVLHVRPALDAKDPAQRRLVREVTEEVVALTERYGGLLWGEHGKGVRSEFSPRVFGPLYPALQAIKTAFDPGNQLNPGKIAAPAGAALLAVDGVPMRGERDEVIPAAARATYASALHCNGNGACFTWDPDEAMCPSYKATRERRHSPKGRAALAREWLARLAAEGVDPAATAVAARRVPGWRSFPKRFAATLGRMRGEPDFSHAVKAAMDGCLACKSCVGQCPIKVDIPTTRARFLESYHSRYLRHPRDHLVGAIETLLPLAARVPWLYAAAVSTAPGRAALARLGLVALPRLSRAPLGPALAARGIGLATPTALRALSAAERARSVVVVQDAFTSSFEAELVLDGLDLLRRLGVRPWLAPLFPNGKPLHVHGFLGRFARVAAATAASLRALAETGVPLIGLDPSMTLTYRSDYAEALPAGSLPPVLLVQEWLAARPEPLPQARERTRLRLLPHCTERTTAAASLGQWVEVFKRCGLELEILRAGCCGMAGTYGHEAEHRATSERIYAQSWARHLAARDRGPPPLATGYSCRSQAKLVDGIALRHPVQELLARLAPEAGDADGIALSGSTGTAAVMARGGTQPILAEDNARGRDVR